MTAPVLHCTEILRDSVERIGSLHYIQTFLAPFVISATIPPMTDAAAKLPRNWTAAIRAWLDGSARSTARVAIAAALFWTTIVAVLALAVALDRLRRGAEFDFLLVFQSYALGFAPWLFLCPLVFVVSRRAAKAKTSFSATVAQGTVLAFVCLAVVAIHIFFIHAPLLGMTGTQLLASVSVQGWVFDPFIFGVCFLAGRVDGERALKEAEAREKLELSTRLLALEREAATLETRELRHRFSSHFILNALSNILGLVRSGDVAGAEQAVITLGQILKRVSRVGGASLSTLAEELDFLEVYLQFQAIRYPSIVFEIDAPPPTRDVPVPAFLLQPLIENAFKHGLAPSGALEVTLTARRDPRGLKITITNSMPNGRMGIGTDGEGLALTRARLELCFDRNYALQRSVKNGHHMVHLHLPETQP